jgi:predicted nucleic acid-binding protein
MVDTNVLIYSTVISSPWHQDAKLKLVGLFNKGIELCITPQIVREYLVILTRGNIFEQNFTLEESLNELGVILSGLTILSENETTVSYLQNLIQRYHIKGKVIHDANIVAVMLTYKINRLITYNIVDFRRFNEIVLEPI